MAAITMRGGPQMRAMVQDRYGSPDVLRLASVARPAVGPGQVLVRVRAAGIARGDAHLLEGRPYLLRIMGFGLRRPRTPVLGSELAGVVESVGAQVDGFRVGDEVMGWTRGTLAELVAVDADHLVRKPAGISWEQAAVVATSGITALEAVRDRGEVRAGQRVLITGAAGGVGSFAVQIACALGAQVTAVVSSGKVELARSIGADRVIDYTREPFPADGSHDVVIDIAGMRSLRTLRRALTPTGTLVIVGGENGGRWLGGVQRSFAAPLLSRFVRQRLRMLISVEKPEHLAALVAMIEAGDVSPVVDRTYPLSEAAEAMRYLSAGHAAGKVAVTMGAEA